MSILCEEMHIDMLKQSRLLTACTQIQPCNNIHEIRLTSGAHSSKSDEVVTIGIPESMEREMEWNEME